MGSGGRQNARALCVYGSESGNAKRAIQKLSKKLPDQGLSVVDVVDGNSISSELPGLVEKCDLLVIACSSFGEGDPPENYNLFLLNLQRAAEAGEKPLSGLQHVVIGYGASCYDTFQNVPRLSDKLLGECGSRRLAMRCELDEGSEEDPVKKLQAWEESTFKVLQNLPSVDTAPVCDWTSPECKILEKTEDDLLMGMSEDGSMGSGLKMGVALAAVVAAAAAYATYFM